MATDYLRIGSIQLRDRVYVNGTFYGPDYGTGPIYIDHPVNDTLNPETENYLELEGPRVA